jgi:hypothetical protein
MLNLVGRYCSIKDMITIVNDNCWNELNIENVECISNIQKGKQIKEKHKLLH